MTEYILPRRSIKQPIPAINKGGDCGACVLGGLLTPVDDDPRSRLVEMYHLVGKVDSISEPRMRQALYDSRGKTEDVIFDMPIWARPNSLSQWGWPGWTMNVPWFQYHKMAIQAGYYGLAMIASSGKGVNATLDHWILICGARERGVPLPHKKGAWKIEQEVLVSNSSSKAKAERWIKVHKFLKQYGGFNTVLVRVKE